MSQIEIPNIRQGIDVHLWLRMVNSGVSVDWTIFDEIRVYIYSESQRQTAGKCTVEVAEDDATLLACEYPALENQFLGVQKVVLYTKLADQQNAYDKVAFCFVATTDETESTTTVEDEVVEVDLAVDDIDTSMLAGAIKAANEAAHSADASAGVARAQGDAAGEAATLAAEKATLAEEKAGEAGEAATLAAEKATLAEEKAGEAGDAATHAAEKAALANEKAGFAQEKGTYAEGQGDYAKEQGDYAKEQGDAAGDAATHAAEKAALANEKAGFAQEKGTYAEGQGDYAKEQGDYAKGEIDDAKGDFDSLNERFNDTEQKSITLDETTDPSDPEYQDEYQRVLAVLYQAIADARQLDLESAQATRAAIKAADVANYAAKVAQAAAELAQQKAAAAQAAANAAEAAMNAARGSYPSLAARLDDLESRKQDIISDLEAIRSGAAKGETALQPGDVKTVAKTGDYDDLTDKPDLKRVATSGKYEDLEGRPTSLSDFENDLAVTFEENDDPASIVS